MPVCVAVFSHGFQVNTSPTQLRLIPEWMAANTEGEGQSGGEVGSPEIRAGGQCRINQSGWYQGLTCSWVVILRGKVTGPSIF